MCAIKGMAGELCVERGVTGGSNTLGATLGACMV